MTTHNGQMTVGNFMVCFGCGEKQIASSALSHAMVPSLYCHEPWSSVLSVAGAMQQQC